MRHAVPILMAPDRFKLLICGRRWGKTGSGLLAALRGHGAYRGQFRGAIDGARIWWVAPDYSQIQSSKIWDDLKRATQGAWIRKLEVEREIILPGGGSITVKSADNEDALRGPGLDGLIMDEAAFIKPEIWRQILRPALADKQGWAMLATTPNGKNWIHNLHQLVKRGEMPGWGTWRSPTRDNPLVTESELESIKREIGPRAFAQEFEAEFTESEGAIFPASYFENHIWASRWPDAFDVSGLFADPSLGKESKQGDYQAIVFAGLTGGKWWVKAWLMKIPPVEFVAEFVRIHSEMQPTFAGMEANGFQSILQPLMDMYCQQNHIPPIAVVPVINTQRKELRIQSLDPLLARGAIQFLPCEGCELVVEQSQMFPDKSYHDDGPDALHGAISLVHKQIASINNHQQNAGDSDIEIVDIYS
jgi:hypothetical protein